MDLVQGAPGAAEGGQEALERPGAPQLRGECGGLLLRGLAVLVGFGLEIVSVLKGGCPGLLSCSVRTNEGSAAARTSGNACESLPAAARLLPSSRWPTDERLRCPAALAAAPLVLNAAAGAEAADEDEDLGVVLCAGWQGVGGESIGERTLVPPQPRKQRSGSAAAALRKGFAASSANTASLTLQRSRQSNT